MMPSITGDGWAFGADGGPINSQDQFDIHFNTGPVKTGGAVTNITLLVVTALLAGLLVWLLMSHSRR